MGMGICTGMGTGTGMGWLAGPSTTRRRTAVVALWRLAPPITQPTPGARLDAAAAFHEFDHEA